MDDLPMPESDYARGRREEREEIAASFDRRAAYAAGEMASAAHRGEALAIRSRSHQPPPVDPPAPTEETTTGGPLKPMPGTSFEVIAGTPPLTEARVRQVFEEMIYGWFKRENPIVRERFVRDLYETLGARIGDLEESAHTPSSDERLRAIADERIKMSEPGEGRTLANAWHWLGQHGMVIADLTARLSALERERAEGAKRSVEREIVDAALEAYESGTERIWQEGCGHHKCAVAVQKLRALDSPPPAAEAEKDARRDRIVDTTRCEYGVCWTCGTCHAAFTSAHALDVHVCAEVAAPRPEAEPPLTQARDLWDSIYTGHDAEGAKVVHREAFMRAIRDAERAAERRGIEMAARHIDAMSSMSLFLNGDILAQEIRALPVLADRPQSAHAPNPS